jgi:hypothetical protein
MTPDSRYLVFGATCPPLWKQLGRKPSDPMCSMWQERADAITRLAVCGLLTEAERHRARKRLLARIVRNLP